MTRWSPRLDARRDAQFCAVLAATLAGCTSPAPAPAKAGGSAEAPQAVRGSNGSIVVAWGSVHRDGRADILIADGRAEHLEPVQVNPRPSTAVAGRQVGPRAAITPGGRVIVSWVDRERDRAGDILVAGSDDGGRTFDAPRRVNDDAGLSGQEYQDIAVLTDGSVVLVWLDERGAPPEDENRKQVYLARSTDGGRTFAANASLTASPHGVCPCCRPGICASGDGALHVIYRDRAGDELFVRVRSIGPGARDLGEPRTVSREGWRFPACPVDGPSLLAGTGGGLRAVWMDGAGGQETLWTAESADGGRSFPPARAFELAAGSSPGRASIVEHCRLGAVAAWEDDGGRVWIRTIDGLRGSALLVAGGGDCAARSPQAVVDGDSVLVFWTETDWRDADANAGSVPPSRLRHARLMVKDGALILPP